MEWTEKDVKTWDKTDVTGFFYVMIPGRERRWVSSKQRTRKRAVEWALNQASGGVSSIQTVRDFTKDFFVPEKCDYVKSRQSSTRKKTAKHWSELRQLLVLYIVPKWGSFQLGAVRPAQFGKWLADLRSDRYPERVLSDARRAKLLFAAVTIWDWAVYSGVIDQNTLRTVPPVIVDTEKRRKFTPEERAAMFPEDLTKVWKHGHNMKSLLTPGWGVAFLIHDDTGLRPQEVFALHWEDYRPNRKAFIVHRAVGETYSDLKGLKTEYKGIPARAVTVSDRLAKILEEGKGQSGLIFARRKGIPQRIDTAGDIFCAGLDQLVETGSFDPDGVPEMRSLIDRQGRTLYSLRHTKNTNTVTDKGRQAAKDLMGHTTDKMTDNYDDPDEEDLLRRAGA